MTTALPSLPTLELDLLEGIGDELAAEAAAWLHDPTRTAHALVTLPTAELVRLAAGTQPGAPSAPAPPQLPGGLWQVLPARLLALHPARRAERLARLRTSPAQLLELAAIVLERWGWAQPERRIRTATGARCPQGALYALYRLGYGTECTAEEAARRIQGVLTSRGIGLPYPQWNDQPHVTQAMVLAIVREAAREA